MPQLGHGNHRLRKRKGCRPWRVWLHRSSIKVCKPLLSQQLGPEPCSHNRLGINQYHVYMCFANHYMHRSKYLELTCPNVTVDLWTSDVCTTTFPLFMQASQRMSCLPCTSIWPSPCNPRKLVWRMNSRCSGSARGWSNRRTPWELTVALMSVYPTGSCRHAAFLQMRSCYIFSRASTV
jgi:hypothetical protein